MSTFAIGDIQGCYQEFLQLLNEINFDKQNDQLWLCGDLVNRGPESLLTLRFIKDLGESAISVLGNHDLHLLAIANGQSQYKHRDDTIDDILNAPDRETLLNWLRQLPLLHRDVSLGYTMVHAGLAPQWSIEKARDLALETQAAISGTNFKDFFTHMYGNDPDQWTDTLSGWDRLRVITNYFTRLRYCELDGRMDFKLKKSPGTQPVNFQPWFENTRRLHSSEKILFGHWAALRNYNIDYSKFNVYPLDTGCLWGGRLTALRLEDENWFSVPSLQEKFTV